MRPTSADLRDLTLGDRSVRREALRDRAAWPAADRLNLSSRRPALEVRKVVAQ